MSYPYEEFESESSKLSRAFAKQVAQKDAAIERAERAEKELREAQALAIRMEIERDIARGAVLCAAEWFKGYADGHEAKGDLDKAKRNRDRENAMRQALKDSQL